MLYLQLFAVKWTQEYVGGVFHLHLHHTFILCGLCVLLEIMMMMMITLRTDNDDSDDDDDWG